MKETFAPENNNIAENISAEPNLHEDGNVNHNTTNELSTENSSASKHNCKFIKSIMPRNVNKNSKFSKMMSKYTCKVKAFSRKFAKAFKNLFNGCIAWVAFYAILHTCCALNPQLTVDAPWLADLLNAMDNIAKFAGGFLKNILNLFNLLIQEIFENANSGNPIAEFFKEFWMFFFG